MEAGTQSERSSKGSMKKSGSKNSESSAPMDSPHSPLRFHSPLRSDAGDPPETSPYESPENSFEKPPDNSRAIVRVEKATQFSPFRSPFADRQKPPEKPNAAPAEKADAASPAKSEPSLLVFNRALRGPAGAGVAAGGGGRSSGEMNPTWRRWKKEEMIKRVALGFRLSEFVLCLISFSVMAADKTQGWSGDSYDRYKEYRYCLSVNVIAFVYSGFQAYDLAYNLISGKQVVRHYLRSHFDFFMDQILAYLLISASSSAATRVDDWQSNWGKDAFTEMASASVSMSFLAFIAFAISSLISGYNLCSPP